MLARIRKAQENEEGFTLIELLVVMIIIGILAAIAIPTFLNQRANGYNSAIKSDLKNAATAIESNAVDSGGTYGTAAEINTLLGTDFNGTDEVTLTAVAHATEEYCLTASHSAGGDTWEYKKSVGTPREGDCTA